jgi:hypothetical protein
MRRFLVVALLGLGLLSFVVWLVSQFFLSILPAPYGNLFSRAISLTPMPLYPGGTTGVSPRLQIDRVSCFGKPGLSLISSRSVITSQPAAEVENWYSRQGWRRSVVTSSNPVIQLGDASHFHLGLIDIRTLRSILVYASGGKTRIDLRSQVLLCST